MQIPGCRSSRGANSIYIPLGYCFLRPADNPVFSYFFLNRPFKVPNAPITTNRYTMPRLLK